MNYISFFVYSILCSLSIFSILGLLATQHLFFDIFSHFRLHYILIFLIPLLYGIIKKKWAILFCSLSFILFNGYHISSVFSVSSTNKGEADIKIMHVNVWSKSDNHSSALEYINTHTPDVLIIEELTPEWQSALKTLNNTYSFHIDKAEDSNFGIGLWSKYPIDDLKVQYIGETNTPSITGYLNKNGKSYLLIATHPYPPANFDQFRMRISQFNSLRTIINKSTVPVILIGDLNTAPTSPVFQLLTSDTSMKNAADGFGIQRSWPTYFPPLSLHLDHCLVSNSLEVVSYATGENIGSDHLPVIVELKLL